MITHFIRKKYFLFAFILFFVVILSVSVALKAMYMLNYPDDFYPIDSADYWNRAVHLRNICFDLSSFDGFRGYVYPLCLALIHLLGGAKAWVVVNAFAYSLFLSAALPSLSGEQCTDLKSLKKTLLCGLSLIVLFSGLFAYTLSDLFAVSLFICAVLLLRKAVNSCSISHFIFLFFGSALCYAAYNVRTIYLFAVLAVALINFIRMRKAYTFLKLIADIITVAAGIIIAAIPQIISNYYNLSTFSISVPTDNLMFRQIIWGLQFQRFDTLFPPVYHPNHPSIGIYFRDPTGLHLLIGLPGSTLGNWLDYIKLFLHHPFDIISIYFRHFVNYIFPCWPQIYVSNLDSSKWFMGLVGSSIAFSTLFIFCERCIKDYRKLIDFIPVVVPAILIIPGAVEYRFSLPLYIFALSQLCFNTDYAMVKARFLAHKWKNLFLFFLLTLFLFTIWSSMLASEAVTPLLL